MGLFSFFTRTAKAGGHIEAAASAASLLAPEDVQEAFHKAMANALGFLSEGTKEGERRSAVALELALACFARQQAEAGKEAGAAMRVRARPLLVGLLRASAAEHGALIQARRISARAAMDRTLGTFAAMRAEDRA
ncbi:MAG: hypothetical protein QM651_03290 [Rhodoblastus sp.]